MPDATGPGCYRWHAWPESPMKAGVSWSRLIMDTPAVFDRRLRLRSCSARNATETQRFMFRCLAGRVVRLGGIQARQSLAARTSVVDTRHRSVRRLARHKTEVSEVAIDVALIA
jgi:hypothetical protein